MKMPNLSELMISISEFKKQASEIISKKMTKVIVKNNEPVSVIVPYGEYQKIIDDAENVKNSVRTTGEDITLENGVQIKVCVETNKKEIVTKTYLKMKTSGEYNLMFTHYLSAPNEDQTLTIEEIRERYYDEKKEV